MTEGLTCPSCGGTTGVTDSRPKPAAIKRRRKCEICGFRFTTIEVIAAMYPEQALHKVARLIASLRSMADDIEASVDVLNLANED